MPSGEKVGNVDPESADAQFLEKCSEVLQAELGVVPANVACRSLWSLYAIGYKDKNLIHKLNQSVEKFHQHLPKEDVVSTFKALAYFGEM